MTSAPADIVDAIGIRHQKVVGRARIISVVPSITELLFDLGLGNEVVGRTGFCFHPKAKVKQVAKVGGTKDFDLEKIRALEPTHLIVNVDENPRELVEAAGQFVPDVIVTHPMGPLDNIALYQLLGAVFRREREAQELTTWFEAAYQEAVDVTCSLPRERVLYIIWKKPWMTISRDTYIARTLAAIGWEQAEVDSPARYPEIEIQSLLNTVDRVLLSSEPYAFRPRDVSELEAMAGGTSGPEVSLIDAEMTSWYGSRAIAGMRYLAQLRGDGVTQA
ncbi:MAG: ABC transporter substrate-binding protein [Betaproteobacteria bacterium]|nr:MAG: ABC transporter substrate-binding protein [Betaproteobacteria bacterium]